MGAWGVQFNENDQALDFLETFQDNPNWSTIENHLREYLAPEGWDGCTTLAAAEVIAAGLGRPSPLLDADLAAWAIANSAGAEMLKDLAAQAIDEVWPRSGLADDPWAETDEGKEWLSLFQELKARLTK
jgi:hypothetical protein